MQHIFNKKFLYSAAMLTVLGMPHTALASTQDELKEDTMDRPSQQQVQGSNDYETAKQKAYNWLEVGSEHIETLARIAKQTKKESEERREKREGEWNAHLEWRLSELTKNHEKKTSENIALLESERQRFLSTLGRHAEEIDILKQNVAQKQDELGSHKSTILQQQEQIQGLASQVEQAQEAREQAMEGMRKEYKGVLDQRNEEISSQKLILENLQSELANAKQETNSLKGTLHGILYSNIELSEDDDRPMFAQLSPEMLVAKLNSIYLLLHPQEIVAEERREEPRATEERRDRQQEDRRKEPRLTADHSQSDELASDQLSEQQ